MQTVSAAIDYADPSQTRRSSMIQSKPTTTATTPNHSSSTVVSRSTRPKLRSYDLYSISPNSSIMVKSSLPLWTFTPITPSPTVKTNSYHGKKRPSTSSTGEDIRRVILSDSGMITIGGIRIEYDCIRLHMPKRE